MTKPKKKINEKFCNKCGELKELLMFGLHGKNKFCDPCLEKHRKEKGVKANEK